MVSLDSLTDLANALEVFFQGLSECGLLSTYNIQLQIASSDFIVQIKFRFLMYQLLKSLQLLLLKTPTTTTGNENSNDITAQISTDLKPNIVEVMLPGTSDHVVTEPLGSFVEACVFTQTEDTLHWGESRNGVLLKEQNGNLIAQGNAINSTTDIIVTCHPATLAAIAGHNFIASPAESVLSNDYNSAKNTVLKSRDEGLCLKDSRENEQCIVRNCASDDVSDTIVEEKTEETDAESKEKCSNTKPQSVQYLHISNTKSEVDTVTENELKSFVSISTNGASETQQMPVASLKSLEQQQVEPLILETFEDEDKAIDSKFSLENPNVMQIVVATAETKDEGEIDIQTKAEERETAIFICEVCERTFVTARSLEIHLSLKHRNKGQCDMCPLRFGSIQSLQEHCKTDHGGTGCFNCLVCGRRFMTKLSYKRHMDTHGGKKGAVCDMCGKTFSRTDYLQKHYMTHNGNRPFTCSCCSRKFISSSQLKVHEKTHSGVKEHVCDMCNKAFSRGDKLKDHMLRHLNIKRFQCSVCKRDYAEKRDLTKHLKVHMK